MLSSCFLSTFVEFRSVVSEEPAKISQPMRESGGHFVFLIGPKNTNLVKDIWILIAVNFCCNPLSGYKREVENGSVNPRQEGHLVFTDWREKHKLGWGHWDLAFYQVLLNSVQCFQRRSQKCHSQSAEARAAILFSDWPEKHKLGKGCWNPASCQVEFRSAVSEEKFKMSQPFRDQGGDLIFPIRPRKHKFCGGRWDLASCQVSLNYVQRIQRRSQKCLSHSEAIAAILFFRSAKKTCYILLPVKFR